jgi:oligopeptide transport system permease protein
MMVPWRRGLSRIVPLAVLGLMLLAALLADVVARHVVGFAYDEIHAADGLLPPGGTSIPRQDRRLVSDPAGFGWLDDGEGRFEVARAPELSRRMAATWRPWKAALQNPRERLDGVPLARLPTHLSWDAADSDGDGHVDHEEMVRWTAPLSLNRTELAAMDGNGDGFLLAHEYRGAPEPKGHPLGTDTLGRDLLVRVLYGLRVTLLVALCATAVAFLLGSLLGLTAGILGGWFDRGLLRLLEVLQAVPFIFVVILLSVASREILTARFESAQSQAMAQALVLFCALGAVQWFSLARYARGLGASLRQSEFVLALRGMGFGTPRIVRHHLLPNTVLPLLAFGTLLVPTLVLEEAFLSFLGFGVQPPFPSLGILLSDGVAFLEFAPTLLLVPALALLALTGSLHLVAHRLTARAGGGGER